MGSLEVNMNLKTIEERVLKLYPDLNWLSDADIVALQKGFGLIPQQAATIRREISDGVARRFQKFSLEPPSFNFKKAIYSNLSLLLQQLSPFKPLEQEREMWLVGISSPGRVCGCIALRWVEE